MFNFIVMKGIGKNSPHLNPQKQEKRDANPKTLSFTLKPDSICRTVPLISKKILIKRHKI